MAGRGECEVADSTDDVTMGDVLNGLLAASSAEYTAACDLIGICRAAGSSPPKPTRREKGIRNFRDAANQSP
jgi:hypothetical protein